MKRVRFYMVLFSEDVVIENKFMFGEYLGCWGFCKDEDEDVLFFIWKGYNVSFLMVWLFVNLFLFF